MAALARAPRSGNGRRTAHLLLMRWLLAVAYLPALTFFGHWPLSVDVPGTSLYVGLPESSSAHEHDHKNHCHADAASCSDKPVTAGATVALLAESVAMSGNDSPLIGMAAESMRWRPQAGVSPLSPPPEVLFPG